MWHSDRPGEMTEETFDSLQHQIPGWIIELAVRGMLPKGQVGISVSLFLAVHAWICISRLIDVEVHMSIIYHKI
jgi:ribosomal protein L13